MVEERNHAVEPWLLKQFSDKQHQQHLGILGNTDTWVTLQTY